MSGISSIGGMMASALQGMMPTREPENDGDGDDQAAVSTASTQCSSPSRSGEGILGTLLDLMG